jgi:sugar lactone lactonase YvrE
MELITAVGDLRCEIGENPLWHQAEQRLYWADIPAGRIFRYSPQSGVCEKIYEGKVVGGFTIQADSSLLLFMAQGTIARWKEGTLTTVIESISDERDSRFNDVIADPEGRVFCGSMAAGERPGRLYRLDTNGKLTKILDGIRCSNGMAFSSDLRYLYYTDSFEYAIYRFHYAQNTGDIAGQEVFIRGAEVDGYPDGLVCDAKGFLWSAHWGGGCIIRYTPDGKEDRRIKIPVERVSSLAFGGPELDTMYVTSAKGDKSGGIKSLEGALFQLKSKIRGVTEFLSRIAV